MNNIMVSLCIIIMFLVSKLFFIKQKTAYEMRISDWSSYVCSSDLLAAEHRDALLAAFAAHRERGLLSVEGINIELLQLGQTQPGGVEKLDDRAVAHRQSGVSVITIKRTTERVGGDGRRQFAHQLWRTHGNCRIGLHLLFAEQIAEPAAQRRQITMQAGRLAPGTAPPADRKSAG